MTLLVLLVLGGTPTMLVHDLPGDFTMAQCRRIAPMVAAADRARHVDPGSGPWEVGFSCRPAPVPGDAVARVAD
ncbi:MAG: hypothetical protein GVY28_05080 [Alphaproteobacteria bacterium]|jgi:hypothetical protein|nr:hypothetical protein [Alphaproteobacteria bacterium]